MIKTNAYRSTLSSGAATHQLTTNTANTALNYFTIVLIFAIALAGFKPFGHTLVQFIIV